MSQLGKCWQFDGQSLTKGIISKKRGGGGGEREGTLPKVKKFIIMYPRMKKSRGPDNLRPGQAKEAYPESGDFSNNIFVCPG